MTMTKVGVSYVKISSDDEGQRIDNYLIRLLKDVPKSKIYRILRKGEVRVNKGRINPSYKLCVGDEVRIPPLTVQATQAPSAPPSQETLARLKNRILYEDDLLLIINKPAGMSVHAGSTVRMGIIEAMRYLYPQYPHLELAHRLDAETTGCLILAKKKKTVRELHELLRNNQIKKTYLALTFGHWIDPVTEVNLPLQKLFEAGGKHVVKVKSSGKESKTIFKTLQTFAATTLVEARLLTGRTHQIRVHCAYLGHPILGDDRYGSTLSQRYARSQGIRGLFLHAQKIDFTLPSTNRHIKVIAPLEAEQQQTLERLAN